MKDCLKTVSLTGQWEHSILGVVQTCLDALRGDCIIVSLGKVLHAATSGEVHRALHGIAVHTQFIMSNFAGALDNLQAFGRVKTCLASSGCVMAREVLGPMNILNMRGFLGKSERLHKTQTTVLDMLSFARLSRLRQRLMTQF